MRIDPQAVHGEEVDRKEYLHPALWKWHPVILIGGEEIIHLETRIGERLFSQGRHAIVAMHLQS